MDMLSYVLDCSHHHVISGVNGWWLCDFPAIHRWTHHGMQHPLWASRWHSSYIWHGWIKSRYQRREYSIAILLQTLSAVTDLRSLMSRRLSHSISAAPSKGIWWLRIDSNDRIQHQHNRCEKQWEDYVRPLILYQVHHKFSTHLPELLNHELSKQRQNQSIVKKNNVASPLLTEPTWYQGGHQHMTFTTYPYNNIFFRRISHPMLPFWSQQLRPALLAGLARWYK